MAALSLQHSAAIPGCVQALPTSSVCLQLRFPDAPVGLCERVEQCLDAALWSRAPADVPASSCWSGPGPKAGQPLPDALSALATLLQRAHWQAGCVWPAAPVWLWNPPVSGEPGSGSAEVYIPSLSPQSLARWLPQAVALLNCLAADAVELPADALQPLLEGLRASAPPGYNNLHLLRAAFALGIPVLPLTRGVYQYGWGARARWLQSTLTDATPGLAVQHARDKALTNRLLALAQLPVPRHAVATSADHAQVLAARLGFPVVVKPVDCDDGQGVRANLHGPAAVREAWDHARRFSKAILVEEHIEGREYRLTVVHGRLLWAHERVPAAVTGDGQHTVAELIARENAVRSRQLTPPRRYPLELDEADHAYLQGRGYRMSAVPAAGERVRLQAIPRAMDGGDGESIMGMIHPDNVRLAERAVQQLGLDVAAVDFLSPDISRPWHALRAVITEVNAVPQLSELTCPDIHQRLLRALVRGDGRIPITLIHDPAAVVATPADLPMACQEDAGLLGLTTPAGLWVGEECLRPGRQSAFEDVRSLQVSRQVERLVVVIAGDDFGASGLPFDRADRVLHLAAAFDPGQAGADNVHPS